MKVGKLTFLVILLLAALVGCARKGPDQLILGKWTGKNKDGEYKLEFKQDKTFAGTMSIVAIEGNWSVEGDKVKASITKFMGMDMAALKKFVADYAKTNPNDKPPKEIADVDKPMIGSFSDDGKTLSLTDPGSTDNSGIVFTRDDSK